MVVNLGILSEFKNKKEIAFQTEEKLPETLLRRFYVGEDCANLILYVVLKRLIIDYVLHEEKVICFVLWLT